MRFELQNHTRRKVSIAHVNDARNKCVLAYLLTIETNINNFEILNVIDVSTEYGEKCVAHSKDPKPMKEKFENYGLENTALHKLLA